MNDLSPAFHLAQASASVLTVGQLGLPENAWAVAFVYLALIALGFAVDVGLVFYFLQKPSRWPEQVVRLESRPWSTRQGAFLLLALMALYFASTALQPLINEWFGGAGDEKGALKIVIQSISFHLIGLGIVVLSLLRRRVTWRDAFGLEPRAILRDVGKGVMFYLAALPFIVFYTFLYQAVLRGVGYEIVMQEVALVVADEQSFWMRMYLMGLAVVLAPLFEEILFRGIGLPLIAQKWGVAPAVVAVSLFFAAIHFHLPSMMPLFVIAVAFSLAYIHSGSIVVPIVMHGLFNGVNVAMLMMLKGFVKLETWNGRIMHLKTIEWMSDRPGTLVPGRARLIDQTKLPGELVYIETADVKDLWRAIKTLQVRGAPAIGVTAAMGVVLAVQNLDAKSGEEVVREVNKAADYLAKSRPTAINLFWALERMKKVAAAAMNNAPDELKTDPCRRGRENPR